MILPRVLLFGFLISPSRNNDGGALVVEIIHMPGKFPIRTAVQYTVDPVEEQDRVDYMQHLAL